MSRLLPLILLFLAGCAAGDLGGGILPSGKMPLAKHSTPLADIVIAPDADENLRFAADELKLHLDKITGASFSIVSRPAEGRKSLRIGYNPDLAAPDSRNRSSASRFPPMASPLKAAAFPNTRYGISCATTAG